MAFWSQFLAAHAEVCALDDGGGVRVRLTGPRAEVRIPVSAPVEEEVRRAWEAEIARALSLEVTLTLEAVPASHPEDVLKIAQSALRRWVAPDDVRLVDGELLVTFSGPGAYALFQSHGGAAWVAQTYPTLPRLAVEVRPEEPLPPEEAVVLPDASDDPVRIGRGAPA